MKRILIASRLCRKTPPARFVQALMDFVQDEVIIEVDNGCFLEEKDLVKRFSLGGFDEIVLTCLSCHDICNHVKAPNGLKAIWVELRLSEQHEEWEFLGIRGGFVFIRLFRAFKDIPEEKQSSRTLVL